MNALDFLVDFAALVSIPDASKHLHDDRSESKRGATVSPSGPPNKRRKLTTGAPSTNMIRNHFPVTPSSSQQTCFTVAEHNPPPRLQDYNAYESYVPHQQDRQPAQTFEQHLQQNPGIGLPYDATCGVAYQPCECEYYPPWTSCYETSCAVPQPWNTLQTPQNPYELRHPEMRFGLLPGGPSTGDFQCRDDMCGCRYFSSHIYRYDMADGYAPWDEKERMFNDRLVDGNKERAWISEREDQYRMRQG
jgi:hypothetical protein